MSVALAPVAISADGSALLQHVEGEEERRDRATASARFDLTPASSAAGADNAAAAEAAFLAFFDVAPTARFILAQRCSRVALQFPDELLSHGVRVVRAIKLAVAGLRAEAATATAATAADATPAELTPELMLYILADTSYGSCCVDEVAAQHANCDLVVHYGFSCLSSTRRLPVRYVFGRKPVALDTMVAKVFDDTVWQPEAESSSSSFSFSFSAPEPSAASAVDAASLPPVTLLFLYNLEYAHLVVDGELPRRIESHLAARNGAGRKYVAAVARVQQEQGRKEEGVPALASSSCSTTGSCGCACKSAVPAAASATPAASSNCGCKSSSAAATCVPAAISSPSASASSAGILPLDSLPPLVFSSSPLDPADPLDAFHLNGYSFSLPHSLVASKELFQGVQIVWIGTDADQQLLTNCMLNYNSNPFHLYNPLTTRLAKEIKSKSKTLARRYYLMEKAKNAEIVGILVGTLGVAHYLDVIKYLQTLLRNSGKKSYLFVVGKLNEPKLGNFAEIDLFVLVACPLNTMFDSTGYYRDVVTPFELNNALKGVEWNGDYRTDFKAILPAKSTDDLSLAAPVVAPAASPAAPRTEAESDDLAHGMRYDPTTGKMRSALPSQLHAQGIRLEDAESGGDSDVEGQLVVVDGQQMVRVEGGALVHIKSASDHFLAQRGFTGLLIKHEGEADDAIAPIEQGLAGIARNYTQTTLAPPAVQQVQTTTAATTASPP